jgi:peptidoglycan/LPS O-acetylase OafA/YrhL
MKQSNNLTALRLIAAWMVLYGHSFVFLGLPEPLFAGWVPLGPLAVYIFFAISGYLISQSWANDPNWQHFLLKRILRIFPALTVCTLLTALVFGPIFTQLPLTEYFSHAWTYNYLSNIVLKIHYSLPGVFETNRYPNAINGSIWSLPIEFFMYIVLLVVGLSKLPRTAWLALAVSILLLAEFWGTRSSEMLVMYGTDLRQVVICGSYFWIGALFHQYGINRFLTVGNMLLIVFAWCGLSRWPTLFSTAGWFFVPMLALAFGLSRGELLSRLTRFDYSYGVYIYAFPIQQAVQHLYPDMGLWPYLAITSGITLALAVASWHLIERPSIRLGKR